MGEDFVIDPRYEVIIRTNSSISLEPPQHHVVSFPVSNEERMLIYGKVDEARLEYELDMRTKNVVVVKPKKKTREDIYGPLLKLFHNYFIRDKHMFHLMNLVSRVQHMYNRYHIGKAKVATMMFLIIGRFYAIEGVSQKLPYDVVKIIAKDVWESRYDNTIWNITLPEVITKDAEGDRIWPVMISGEETDYNDPYRKNSIPLWIQQIPIVFSEDPRGEKEFDAGNVFL